MSEESKESKEIGERLSLEITLLSALFSLSLDRKQDRPTVRDQEAEMQEPSQYPSRRKKPCPICTQLHAHSKMLCLALEVRDVVVGLVDEVESQGKHEREENVVQIGHEQGVPELSMAIATVKLTGVTAALGTGRTSNLLAATSFALLLIVVSGGSLIDQFGHALLKIDQVSVGTDGSLCWGLTERHC